jgi:hypothetical protein
VAYIVQLRIRYHSPRTGGSAGLAPRLTEGIIDPSIPGPWVAAAEPGPTKAEDVHRHIG